MMDVFVISSYESIMADVKSFMVQGRPVLSNYYGITNDYVYKTLSTRCSLIINQQNVNGFGRLFFLSRDIDDLAFILNSLDDMTYVFNIPVRNELGIWQTLLDKINFSQYGRYLRYYNKEIVSAKEFLESIANEEPQIESEGYTLYRQAKLPDFTALKSLLLGTFDIYTDYLPSDSQLECMIRGGRVFVNVTPEEKICGLAVFENTGMKCYQNFWIDKCELGLYLMKKMYEQMVDNNISYTYFWVADWNKSVINLHKKLGSLPDGMIDYTFIKKSSHKYEG